MTHRLTTNYAKNYCNRTLIVKVIVENVVTCFLGTRCSYHAQYSSRESSLVLVPDVDFVCRRTHVIFYMFLSHISAQSSEFQCRQLSICIIHYKFYF